MVNEVIVLVLVVLETLGVGFGDSIGVPLLLVQRVLGGDLSLELSGKQLVSMSVGRVSLLVGTKFLVDEFAGHLFFLYFRKVNLVCVECVVLVLLANNEGVFSSPASILFFRLNLEEPVCDEPHKLELKGVRKSKPCEKPAHLVR